MGRLTIRTENGAALKLDNPQNETEARKQLHDKYLIAIDKLAHYEDLEEVGRLIEVRYGEWKPVLFDSVCSLCGYSETTPLMIMRRDFKYCPNCGAKMELKELEE